MNPTLAMFGRYFLAIAISFAVGRGWIPESAGSVVSDFVTQAVALLAAFLPAIWAAIKVDNTPLPPSTR
jgi:hypothetical protein